MFDHIRNIQIYIVMKVNSNIQAMRIADKRITVYNISTTAFILLITCGAT